METHLRQVRNNPTTTATHSQQTYDYPPSISATTSQHDNKSAADLQ